MNTTPTILGPEVSYIDLLDAATMARQEAELETSKPKNPLRPSAAGQCARALAYQYNEYKGHAKYPPDLRSASVLRLLDLGHSVEYSLIQHFKRAEIFHVQYQQQVLTFDRLDDGKLIEGSIDLVLCMPDHKCIADVKSKGIKFSSGYKSSWDEEQVKFDRMTNLQKIGSGYYADNLRAFLNELDDPMFADNFLQLNFYACNDFVLQRGIDHAAIFRYCKNDSRVLEIRFRPDPSLSGYVSNKFTSVARAIDSGAGPEAIDREFTLGSSKCAFCRFKTNCWPELDTKRAFFDTLPDKAWPKDTNRLGDKGTALEATYEAYKLATAASIEANKLEQSLVSLMLDERNRINKVRFSDGSIFELKYLKTPRPHYELRRGKL